MGPQAGGSLSGIANIKEPDSVLSGRQKQMVVLLGTVQELQWLAIATAVQTGGNLSSKHSLEHIK